AIARALSANLLERTTGDEADREPPHQIRARLFTLEEEAEIVKTEVPDVNETLEYRSGAAMMDPVPNALGLCLFALFMLTLDDEPPVGIVVASGVVLTAGIGWIVFALYRRSHPGRALFVLSPAGILYPIYRAKAALIPWQEIENVD